MKKTLVVARHSPGPHHNGYDGCHARFGNEGMCPGVSVAEWLNSLGPDGDTFLKTGERIVTNGQVRENYINGNHHIKRKGEARKYWLEVEIQERRNGKVLYLHDKDRGITVLRVCRLPKDFPENVVDITYQG